MTKTFHNSSFLFVLLQSEKCAFKKNIIRVSESLHDVTPVKTWSSKAMGTSVAACLFTIFGPITFWGPVTFQIYWPPGPVDTKA